MSIFDVYSTIPLTSYYKFDVDAVGLMEVNRVLVLW
jgi:hypothetical protein